MTKDELLKALKEINDRQYFDLGFTDCDEDHQEADKLLLEFINDEEVTKIFLDIEKWYA